MTYKTAGLAVCYTKLKLKQDKVNFYVVFPDSTEISATFIKFIFYPDFKLKKKLVNQIRQNLLN